MRLARATPTRADLLAAFDHALAAVNPATAVKSRLVRVGRTVELGDEHMNVDGVVRIIAIGKAGAGMARGAVDVLGDLVTEGVVVSDHPEPVPGGLHLIIGDHPYPGAGSRAGGDALVTMARVGQPGDLLLVLVSGGGSSLAEVPVDGLTMDDLMETSRALMAAGAPIAELNCVRRHLSRLKNGGLLAAAGDTPVMTLLVSDVVDGPPSLIASGPTLADGTSPKDAVAILIARLDEEPPRHVLEVLRTQATKTVGRTRHKWMVVADGEMAANAAASALGEAGFAARVAATALRGEAAVEAERRIEIAPPGISILTGETTVSGAISGRGGRSQEAALAAAVAISGRPGHLFAALGTDGIDGPTDAAGAIVDAQTVERGDDKGLDVREQLRTHDSYAYLEATNDLVRIGPSGTNVGDLWFVVKPESAESGV